MTKTKKILLLIFMLETVIVASCTYYLSIPSTQPAKALLPAIVRLYGSTGHFICSGTVISKKVIITAAHCLGSPPIITPMFEVRSVDEKPRGIVAFVAGANPSSDLAVLHGDFQDFDTMSLTVRAKEIVRSFQGATPHLIVCGYPHGGDLACFPLLRPKQYMFQYEGTSNIYPGMSGGPVIDQDNNSVVAVSTGVMEDARGENTLVLVSPTIEIFHDTETTGLK